MFKKNKNVLLSGNTSSFDIFNSLCQDYLAILVLNVSSGSAELVTDGSELLSNFAESINENGFNMALDSFAKQYIYVEDRIAAINCLTLDNIQKEVQGKNRISFTFRRYDENQNLLYTKMEIRTLPNSSSNDNYLLTLTDVTSEVQQSMIQRDKLQKAYHDIQRASDAKNLFMHNMSHDIRTPLNAIVGYTTVASDHVQDSDAMRDYLSKIYSSSQNLIHIVNEILDYGSLENGEFHLSQTTLTMRTLINQVYETAKPMLADKQINLRIEMNPEDNIPLLMDSNHMERVLANLISNSIKFSEPGSEILLAISDELPVNNKKKYTFTIQDNGIGISESFIDKIFNPYERERTSTESRKDGVGIGLAIVKHIVDALHGTINVKSKVGQGTTVTLSFDFQISYMDSQAASPKAVSTTLPIKGKRILVVDDSKVNRDIANAILEGLNAKVEVASDGDVAVAMFEGAKSGYYDMILMDIQMPQMDGFEATRQIRKIKREHAQKIPIIALTADVFDTTKRTAYESGMSDFLTKPINVKNLTETLVKYFS